MRSEAERIPGHPSIRTVAIGYGLDVCSPTRDALSMVARNPDAVFGHVHDGEPPSRKIYIGVSSFLPERVYQHRNGLVQGFTKTHKLHWLVWYDRHKTMASAIQGETSLKRYPREWKINLIERENRYWEDLYPDLIGERRLKKAVEALNQTGPAQN